MSATSSPDWGYRTGAATLAFFAGGAVGLLLDGVSMLSKIGHAGFGTSMLASALAASVCGLIFPAAAMDFVEAVIHFFVGLFKATANGAPGAIADALEGDLDQGIFKDQPTPQRDHPPFLQLAFTFGVLFAFFTGVLWAIRS